MNPKQKAFIAAFAKSGNVSVAAKAAKVGRRTHYEWMGDPAYATTFEDARSDATELLEKEATRRAVRGVLEPKFWQGVQCGTVRRYSDVLLIFLLKGLNPEKYRDNAKIEHSGPGGAPLSIEVTFVRP